MKELTKALVERAIARTGASEANGEGGLVELTLVPTGAYRALAAQAAGITATVKVTFTAAGHAPVVDELDVKFSGRPASAAAKRRPKRSTRRAGR